MPNISKFSEERISNYIQSQMPAFIRSDNENFVSFIESYYKFIESKTTDVILSSNIEIPAITTGDYIYSINGILCEDNLTLIGDGSEENPILELGSYEQNYQIVSPDRFTGKAFGSFDFVNMNNNQFKKIVFEHTLGAISDLEDNTTVISDQILEDYNYYTITFDYQNGSFVNTTTIKAESGVTGTIKKLDTSNNTIDVVITTEGFFKENEWVRDEDNADNYARITNITAPELPVIHSISDNKTPLYAINNLFNFNDVGQAFGNNLIKDSEYYSHITEEIMVNWPKIWPKEFYYTIENRIKETIVSNISDLYSSKGTGESISMITKMLWGSDVEVEYPSEKIHALNTAYWDSSNQSYLNNFGVLNGGPMQDIPVGYTSWSDTIAEKVIDHSNTSKIQDGFYYQNYSYDITGDNIYCRDNFRVSSADCGYNHNIALKNDGDIIIWGENSRGQLGDSTRTNKRTPITLASTDTYNWVSVAAGKETSYAIKSKSGEDFGTLWSWGANDYGQLGYDTTDIVYGDVPETTNTLTLVDDENTWRNLGGYASIREDGSIWAWGNNEYGQVGDGTTINRLEPVKVGHSRSWKKVVNGACHTLAISEYDELFVWGRNDYGQLGLGSTNPNLLPIYNSGTWKDIAVGYMHSVGVKEDGSLWAWGSNMYGQLGLGSSEEYVDVPTRIGGDNDWVAVSTKYYHTIALKSDGTIYSWGKNNEGQLGDGTNEDKDYPVQVGTDDDWEKISAGVDYSLALKSDGTIYSWGVNSFGGLGLGENEAVKEAAMTSQLTPKLIEGGSTVDWSVLPSAGHNSKFVVAIKHGDQLWGWGRNNFGQLGDGTTVSKITPTLIDDTSSWAKVAQGSYHVVSIKNDGTLWGWGNNRYGQLGDGTTDNKITPTQIGTDNNWAMVTCGEYTTLALNSNGELWAWGRNDRGQLGIGTLTHSSTPVKVGNQFASVDTYGSHVLAIKTDGTLWAWGNNSHNQLGYTDDYSIVSAVSSDVGETWEQKFIPATGDWSTIGYGNNIFVLLGSCRTNTALITEDWETWTEVELPVSRKWSSIAYGNGVFIAVSSENTNQAIKSIDDGQTWTEIELPTTAAWKDISYGNGRFVTIAYGRVSATTFDDGVNWTQGELPYYLNWTSIAYGDSKFFAVASNFAIVATTTNGIDWSFVDLDSYVEWTDIVYGDKFVIISTNNSRIAYSENSITWEEADLDLPITANWNKITYGNGKYFITAPESDVLLESSNGIDWTERQLPVTQKWTDLIYGNSYFVALSNDTTASRTSPSQIGEYSDWSSVSAGYLHSMAIRDNGSEKTLWAWGNNEEGQLGDGTVQLIPEPIQIGDSVHWSKVSTALHHSAAIKTDGTLWAWGQNTYNQLGDGSFSNRLTPTQIGVETSWVDVETSHDSTYAKTSIDQMYSWGQNDYGQLGYISGYTYTASVSEPHQIGSESNWFDIEAGHLFSAALKETEENGKTLWTWGYNEYGQLGLTNNRDVNTPTMVGRAKTDRSLIGEEYIVYNWTEVSTLQNALHVINGDGELYGVGYNELGNLGVKNGKGYYETIVDGLEPAQVGSDFNWKAVYASKMGNFALAIKTDGTLWAWGDNAEGQLGDGTNENRFEPVQIAPDIKWTKASPGTLSVAAISTENYLYTWGNNYLGQLGANFEYWRNSNSPIKVTNTKEWKDVASADSTVAAIKTNGTLWTWGSNSENQLGYDEYNSINFPIQVGDDIWESVSAGANYFFSINTNNKLYGWGSKGKYLGDVDSNITEPQLIPGDIVWDKIFGGRKTSIGISNEIIYTWGEEYIGDTILNSSKYPVTIINIPTNAIFIEDYRSVIRDIVHPAGMKMFINGE